MNVLIVSATTQEVQTDYPHLVTGVGMVATAIAVSKALSEKHYDLVVNAGIAGSFNRSIPLGSVVEVVKDQLSEIGAQDGSHFLSPTEMGLEVITAVEMTAQTNLPTVSGITVNTVHGDDKAISQIVHRLNPQVESMEGAACMLACQHAGVPCVQLRAISNYVEKRNKAVWDIPLAIQKLNQELTKFLSEL
ncbi:MAG: futalosine hydrolase [Flavobacteriales bacterium]|nr:futalosine hydrolase [Flavobacteriales bacterium]|tara:strand:+ start:3096 stop:3668 length:573 start_codon:yes stop_codon:yes gene_type:complete